MALSQNFAFIRMPLPDVYITFLSPTCLAAVKESISEVGMDIR
jgi:hypothetical protein